MTETGSASEHGRRYWLTPLLRAVIVAVAAATITFTADHSSHFGLLVFGLCTILLGAAAPALGWRALPDATSRGLFVAAGLVGVACGVVALAFVSGGLGLFLYLVTVWAILTGFLELFAGFRLRSRSALARDWMVMGGLTVLLALAFLLVPPDTHDAYRGDDGVSGVVTAPIVLVGVLGAYYAIAAVYLAIGAFSIKWGTGASAPAQGSRA